jgi:plasmid stability protein
VIVDRLRTPPYSDTVKNVTVSLDDETYRRARVRAAELDTSVSALVRRFLSDLAAGESIVEASKRRERELRARITDFRAGERVDRDRLHDRNTRG